MRGTRRLAVIGTAITLFGLAATQAGCGQQVPAATAASIRACHQRYEAWQHGAAAAQLSALSSDTAALTRAGRAEDINGALKWLKAAGLAAAGVARRPEPACADPAGLYRQYLAILVKGGRDTAQGLNGLMDDEVKLRSLRGIYAGLRAELNRTVGRSR